MSDIDREQLAWAAGLFDGEGSISYCVRTQGKYTYPQIQLCVSQSGNGHAESLLARFQKAVCGLGMINGPYVNKGHGKKPRWHWSTAKFETIQAVVCMLWPWLHTTKRSDVVRVLTSYRDRLGVA